MGSRALHLPPDTELAAQEAVAVQMADAIKKAAKKEAKVRAHRPRRGGAGVSRRPPPLRHTQAVFVLSKRPNMIAMLDVCRPPPWVVRRR